MFKRASVSIIELGSAGGFLEDYIPGLITTEIFHLPNVRAVVDGTMLSFSFGLRRFVETSLEPWMVRLPMFARITLVRT
jgi:hypothetical protein